MHNNLFSKVFFIEKKTVFTVVSKRKRRSTDNVSATTEIVLEYPENVSDSSLTSFVSTKATNSVAFQDAGLVIETPTITSKIPATTEAPAAETTTSGSSSVLSLPLIWFLMFYGGFY